MSFHCCMCRNYTFCVVQGRLYGKKYERKQFLIFVYIIFLSCIDELTAKGTKNVLVLNQSEDAHQRSIQTGTMSGVEPTHSQSGFLLDPWGRH